MPVHDWTRVDAGTFHDFHNAWIIHLKEALNEGLLPEGYYAQSEQHGSQFITDIMTLRAPTEGPGAAPDGGGLAVAEAPPRVGRRLVPRPRTAYRLARRTLTIRHVSGHRVVALVEIASPANKDRTSTVEQFAGKVARAVEEGCHAQVIDLFPPGPHDPGGLNAAVCERLGLEESDEADGPAAGKPLTLGSYVAARLPEAYVEALAVGDELPAMPLFLTPETYIPIPLEPTYAMAWRGMPAYWRGVIEGR